MIENHKFVKIEKICKKILSAILFLFLVELILGGSGNVIIIGGLFIRKILFALSFIGLCLYVVFFARKITIHKLDWFVFGFLIVNIIWMTLIPYIQGTSVITAIDDGDTLFVLALYFPAVFLIRQGKLDWAKIIKQFLFITVMLAVWHIVMYVLESLDPGSYLAYYKSFLTAVTFGFFGGASPILGFGFVRIITTTSIYLVVAFFYLLGRKDKKVWHYISLFLLIAAIMCTLTRSLLISTMTGLIIFIIPVHKTMMGKKWLGKLILAAGICMVFVLINYLFIAPLSEQYVQNINEKYQSGEELNPSEMAVVKGLSDEQDDVFDRIESSTSETEFGNTLRSEQTVALLEKWKESPVIGFGYGSYAEDCVRSSLFPYMYESTVPMLLMKLGIAGLVLWVVLIAAMVYTAFKNKYKNKKPGEFMVWLISCIVFALSIQTNPFLFTFCGMSLIVFFCLDAEQQNPPKNNNATLTES
ncbi:MAG: O-antigen ligase family protein [Eubacteriales bacterium]|nr:O-antigen ligase family protein [Eubacteriales bacterium]